MKTLVFILFSSFSFSCYSQSPSLGDSINELVNINRDGQRETECPPEAGGPQMTSGEAELPGFIDKMKSLSHNGKKFNCFPKTIKGCSYQQCNAPSGMFSKYPKPMAVLVPKNMSTPKSFKVHIHGFSYFNKKYDKSLNSMVDSFEYGKTTCQNSGELVLIPYSEKNKNNHHHTYLASTKKFDDFMEEFQKTIGKTENLPVSLSGHSGGGKVISQIVSYVAHDSSSKSATRRVKQVDIHDGLYSSEWVINFSSWFEKSKGVEMNIYSVRSTSTSGHSNSLFNRFGDNAQTVNRTHPQTNRSYFQRESKRGSNRVKHVEEKSRGGEHHWELSRDYWGY